MANKFLEAWNQGDNHLLHLLKLFTVNDQPYFLQFLQNLNFNQREQAITFLKGQDLRHLVWETIITFFPEPTQQSQLTFEETQHFQQLALILLKSDHLKNKNVILHLSLLLNGQQLANLVNALKPSQNYAYRELLRALTVRARCSPAEYQCFIHDYPDLANELIVTRLQQQPGQHHQLLEEVFDNKEKFNWQDITFSCYITDCFLKIAEKSTGKTLQSLLGKFFRTYRHKRSDLTHFFDAFIKATADIQSVIQCITHWDDEDKQFLFHFLINSKTQDPELIKQLLAELNLKKLIQIGPHIVAIRQRSVFNNLPIAAIYAQIVADKLKTVNSVESESSLHDLAEILSCVTEGESIVNALFEHFSFSLQYHWLNALLKMDYLKNNLFLYCFNLLPQFKLPQIISLLERFNAKELAQFYLFMLVQKTDKMSFSCFPPLIKNNLERSLELFLTAPNIHFQLSQDLFNDEILVNLLEQLCKEATADCSYEETLEKLLSFYCQRLGNATHAIHGYVNYKKHAHLGLYLLNSPANLMLLCPSQQSWFSKKQKSPFTAIFNELVINEKQMDNIALHLLAYYRDKSAVLQTFFTHLFTLKNELSSDGYRNFNQLLASCKKILLQHERNDVNDENFFTKEIVLPNRLSPILSCLATIHATNSKLGAAYFLDIPQDKIRNIDDQALIGILIHSNEPVTLSNWQKIESYLNTRSDEESAKFVKQLINSICSRPENPDLNKQALIFIQNLLTYPRLIVFLDKAELKWLVKSINSKEWFKWLDLILESNQFDNLLFLELFLSLPNDEDLLNDLYQLPALQPYLSTLFAQLAIHSACHHLLAIYAQIGHLENTEKYGFFETVLLQLTGKTIDTPSHFILMMLFAYLELDLNCFADKSLVINYLNFLKVDSSNSNQDLLQIFLNLINHLNKFDLNWSSFILSHPCFAQIIPNLLSTVEKENIRTHPFSNFLWNNANAGFDLSLRNNESWQNYLACMLSNPPTATKPDQFALLFNQLNLTKQQYLARTRLNSPMLNTENKTILILLSKTLLIDDINHLAQRSTVPELFLELIIQHPQGFNLLNKSPEMLTIITQKEHLSSLFNSDSSREQKFNLVSAIFIYLTQEKKPLTTWFNELKIDGLTLANFANYTRNTPHQEQLFSFIDDHESYQKHLKAVLLNPPGTLRVEQNSALYHYVYLAMTKPQSGWQCNRSFYSQLAKKDQEKALKHQFSLLIAVEQLSDFYKIFDSALYPIAALYAGARWIQQLSLISHEILKLSNFKSQDASFNNILKQFTLKTPSQHDLVKFYLALNTPSELNNDEQPYFLTQHVFEHYTDSHLTDLFICHSQHDDGKLGKTPILSEQNKSTLENALDLHQQHLENRKYSCKESLNFLLKQLVNSHLLETNFNLQKWLIKEVLLSPISWAIEETLVYQLIDQIPLSNTSIILHDLYNLYPSITVSLLLFNRAEISSFSDSLTYFYSLQDKELFDLLNTCQFAKLQYLGNFLNLVISSKLLKLTIEQVEQLIISQHGGYQYAHLWLKNDIQQLQQFHQGYKISCLELGSKLLSYRADNLNLQRLTALNSDFLLPKQRTFLTGCLNSYYPLLQQNNNSGLDQFYKIIMKLSESPTGLSIIRNLDRTLYTSLFTHLLKEAENHEKLINTLLQFGPHESNTSIITNCLKSILFELFPTLESPPHSITQLTAEQLASLSSQQMRKLIKHYYFYYYLKPLNHLQVWQKNFYDDKHHERALFCQEVSLYLCLLELEKKVNYTSELSDKDLKKCKDNLFICFNFLEEKSNKFTFLSLVDEFSIEEIRAYPDINFYRLLLFSFIAKQPAILLSGFVEWLTCIEAKYCEHIPALKQLLNTFLEMNLYKDLCEFLIKNPIDDEAKSTWLFDTIFQSQKLQPYAIQQIIPACPWTWISNQLKKSTSFRLEILQTAIKNASHCQVILSNAENTLDFLLLLEQLRLPVNAIIATYEAGDICLQVDNLLIVHLLTREDYLKKLPGESLLNKFNERNYIHRKRLQPIMSGIDLRKLPSEILSKFQPEAAATLLCSPRYFHLLSEEKVKQLLLPINNYIPAFIGYWLRFYATMPNAENLLIILAKLHFKTLVTSLDKLEIYERSYLVQLLIKRLSLLITAEQFSWSLLLKLCTVSDLDYAIELFLYAQPDNKLLADFIIDFLTKSQLKTLPDKTWHLLVQLSENRLFSGQENIVQKATANYWQQDMFLQNDSIFYDDGQLQVKRLFKLIHYNEIRGQESIVEKIYDNVQQLLPQAIPARFIPSNLDRYIPTALKTNSILQDLAKKFREINVFNYFLIHFKGNIDQLSSVLNDYFCYISFNGLTNAREKSLLITVSLVNKHEINGLIRHRIYDLFLQHPKLITTEIAEQLILFDSEKTLKAFGKNSSYDDFISLCTALEPIFKEKALFFQSIKKAKEEAAFELSILKMKGWFLNFRIRIARCLFYRWRGWFNPKLPQFVQPCYEPFALNTLDELNKPLLALPSLTSLLNHLDKQQVTVKDLNILAHVLKRYNLQTSPLPQEQTIRQRVESFYQRLQYRKLYELPIRQWLNSHEEPFTVNRHYLLGLYCINNENDLLNQILNQSPQLTTLKAELDLTVKLPFIDEQVSMGSQTTITSAVQRASHTIHNFWNAISKDYFNNTAISCKLSSWLGR